MLRFLYIGNGANPSPLVNDILEQLVEYGTWLFVRYESNSVTNRTTRYINVTELTRHERRIITLDTKTPSFKTSR